MSVDIDCNGDHRDPISMEKEKRYPQPRKRGEKHINAKLRHS